MNISFIESSKFGSTLYDSFIIHRGGVRREFEGQSNGLRVDLDSDPSW